MNLQAAVFTNWVADDHVDCEIPSAAEGDDRHHNHCSGECLKNV